jgi:biotin carboxyl carrier protein
VPNTLKEKQVAKEVIEAPITGTIISIEVKVGDKVEEGDVLLYIESMKMENPIMAPVNGTVTEISVSPKQVVESGKQLMVIEY